MRAESLVPSFSTCERLLKAGFPQDTLCAWVAEEYEQGGVMVPCIPWLRADVGLWREGLVAAPTLQEVLAQLPPEIWRGGLSVSDGLHGRYYLTVGYVDARPPAVLYQRAEGQVMPLGPAEGWARRSCENPAEAAALLYLALVEAGHIERRKGGFGSAKGLIEMAPDFDAPLSDSEDGHAE